jgi:Nucleotidyltransferase of unknown function (DUF6036)
VNRAELEHAIRAACDVADETELWVFGSQSILGQHPDASEGLRFSMELDVDPKNYPERADRIDGALGEASQFHETFGFYVHGVSIESAILPDGWQSRAVVVENENTQGHRGFCLDASDLAASKLVANRDKDREFVRTLLREHVIDSRRLEERIHMLPISTEEKQRLRVWVSGTVGELDA